MNLGAAGLEIIVPDGLEASLVNLGAAGLSCMVLQHLAKEHHIYLSVMLNFVKVIYSNAVPGRGTRQ